MSRRTALGALTLAIVALPTARAWSRRSRARAALAPPSPSPCTPLPIPVFTAIEYPEHANCVDCGGLVSAPRRLRWHRCELCYDTWSAAHRRRR